jgi:D-glycero-D-manno-heptose 1,7-bisphosphate phosphatase
VTSVSDLPCPAMFYNSKLVLGARTLVFDRDGTINIDNGYVHQITDFEFTLNFSPILEILAKFQGNICIITNQGGASIGKYNESDSRKFTEYLISRLKEHGITINLVVTCYHHNKDHCKYRKPETGMLEKIESIVNAHTKMYLYVGNDEKDAKVAMNRHVRYLDINSENFLEKFKDWIDSQ